MEYASLHGGRVTWDHDTTSFAFALAVDPAAAPTEVNFEACCESISTVEW